MQTISKLKNGIQPSQIRIKRFESNGLKSIYTKFYSRFREHRKAHFPQWLVGKIVVDQSFAAHMTGAIILEKKKNLDAKEW